MPRSRANTRLPISRTTASTPPGSGCSSGMLLPPVAVLLVGCLLAAFANRNVEISRTAQAASDSAAVLSPIFTPEIQYWGQSIFAWSAEFGLDPNLAAAVMQIESCGDARARSSAGAMGLFQVMPFHFNISDDPYEPATNARRGLNYLFRALERAGGDARLALAGYNGGVGLIGRAEWSWPAETKRYVYYGGQIYVDAHNGAVVSERLTEWYNKYGAGLCAQAAQRIGLP